MVVDRIQSVHFSKGREFLRERLEASPLSRSIYSFTLLPKSENEFPLTDVSFYFVRGVCSVSLKHVALELCVNHTGLEPAAVLRLLPQDGTSGTWHHAHFKGFRN